MVADAREFIDFWIENSVHADDDDRRKSGDADRLGDLVNRCLDMAASQGLSQAQIEAEVGDLRAYLKGKLAGANVREAARLADRDPK